MRFNKYITDSSASGIIMDDDFNEAAALLYLRFMKLMNERNLLIGSPDDVAAKCKMSRYKFNEALRCLKQKDVIRKLTKKEYMLNPHMAHNGNVKSYQILKHIWDTQTSKGLRKC